MVEFADDATLLVPAKSDVQLQKEYNNIAKWASDNKLTINMSKTKELAFHNHKPRNYLPPSDSIDNERVSFVKLLGVWLQEDLGIGRHVGYVTHICNQRLYLLNQLKKARFNLPPAEIQSVLTQL